MGRRFFCLKEIDAQALSTPTQISRFNSMSAGGPWCRQTIAGLSKTGYGGEEEKHFKELERMKKS